MPKSRLARHVVTVRLRNGMSIRCRVSEFWSIVESFVMQEYGAGEFEWPAMRTIVDVGANIGAATAWFAGKAPAARILAIEPSRDALQLLAENVTSNRFGDRVEIIPAALGASPGVGRVVLDDAQPSTATRVTSAAGDGPEVPIRTLKEVLDTAGIDYLDLLKLDCEGAEFDVLGTAGPELLRRIGAIVGEYHGFTGHSAEELVQPLTEAGFTVSLTGASGIGLFRALRTAKEDVSASAPT